MIINTARNLAKEARSGQKTMLIVDECHRAATNENSKAIDIAPNATLGLSATPEREYDSGFEDIISPIIGEVIYNYDYARAKADRVISDFELNNVRISLSDEDNFSIVGKYFLSEGKKSPKKLGNTKKSLLGK